MSRNITAVTLVTIASATIGLMAAATREAVSQQAPVVRITVIGCLQPSDQSRTATSGTTGRPTDTKYELNKAKTGKSDSNESTSATTSQSASTYRLDAKDETLSPHVGKQVEIVAVVEEPDNSAPTGTSGSKSASSAQPKLKVESIRMIAQTCPQ